MSQRTLLVCLNILTMKQRLTDCLITMLSMAGGIHSTIMENIFTKTMTIICFSELRCSKLLSNVNDCIRPIISEHLK